MKWVTKFSQYCDYKWIKLCRSNLFNQFADILFFFSFPVFLNPISRCFQTKRKTTESPKRLIFCRFHSAVHFQTLNATLILNIARVCFCSSTSTKHFALKQFSRQRKITEIAFQLQTSGFLKLIINTYTKLNAESIRVHCNAKRKTWKCTFQT